MAKTLKVPVRWVVLGSGSGDGHFHHERLIFGKPSGMGSDAQWMAEIRRRSFGGRLFYCVDLRGARIKESAFDTLTEAKAAAERALGVEEK